MRAPKMKLYNNLKSETTMQTLIQDQTYANTQAFFYKASRETWLPDSIKEQLATMYSTLTTDNAKTIYEEASNICKDYSKQCRYEFFWDALKISGGVFAVSAGMVVVSFVSNYLIKNYTMRTNKYEKYTDTMTAIGVGGMIFGWYHGIFCWISAIF